MARHCDNADKVVAYLDGHPQVERVYFPGLKSFNGHEFAKKQMNRYGSRVAFVVKGGKPAGQAFAEVGRDAYFLFLIRSFCRSMFIYLLIYSFLFMYSFVNVSINLLFYPSVYILI